MPSAASPLCFTCGQSALGVAMDGRWYCHRRECVDWKAERWMAQQERDRRHRELLRMLIKPQATFLMPIDYLLRDEDFLHAPESEVA